MTAVLGMLDRVEELAKATPPVDNKASRFGNPAFRTFYDKVQEVCVPCCQKRIIMEVDTTRPRRHCILHYRIYLKRPSRNWQPTLARRGAIGRA